MAFVITQGELLYQSDTVLVGKAYKIFLANRGSLTEASPITSWEANEVTVANGYAAITGTVGTGSYNAATQRYEAPVITGTFGPATGIGFTFDTMVIKLAGRTLAYAINQYALPVTLAAGQTRGFTLTLAVIRGN